MTSEEYLKSRRKTVRQLIEKLNELPDDVKDMMFVGVENTEYGGPDAWYGELLQEGDYVYLSPYMPNDMHVIVGNLQKQEEAKAAAARYRKQTEGLSPEERKLLP